MLEWLTHTWYAEWVNTSWGWPLALRIHAFGTATVVGFMAIIGLRLFGLFQTIPYTSLRKLIPYIWVAVVFQAISGATLWMTKPAQYLADGMFEIKITLVVIAIVVMWYFQNTMKREVAGWAAAGNGASRRGKFVTAVWPVWVAATIWGRLAR